MSNIASGSWSVICGGQDNDITGSYSFIGSGLSNIASGSSSFIGGGKDNNVTGSYAFIGGGQDNLCTGTYSFIGSGLSNITSGSYSIALGRKADASLHGTFVWGNGEDAKITSTLINAVYFQASGGMHVYTATDGGTSLGATLHENATAWSALSDRNKKENFEEIDTIEVLLKLVAIPVTKWNYKAQVDKSIKHMGPVSQDFWEAYQLGHDDLSIDTLNADGVTMAALQGLYKLYEESQEELEVTKEVLVAVLQELGITKTELEFIKQRLNALEQK